MKTAVPSLTPVTNTCTKSPPGTVGAPSISMECTQTGFTKYDGAAVATAKIIMNRIMLLIKLSYSFAALAIVFSFFAFGQSGAKLTEGQKAVIANANQQTLVAQYLSRIAELERQLAEMQVKLVVAEACSSAEIKLDECEVKQDGSVSRKVKQEAKAK